jgi:hypothetical protein
MSHIMQLIGAPLAITLHRNLVSSKYKLKLKESQHAAIVP